MHGVMSLACHPPSGDAERTGWLDFRLLCSSLEAPARSGRIHTTGTVLHEELFVFSVLPAPVRAIDHKNAQVHRKLLHRLP
jgi:hypothetical protein